MGKKFLRFDDKIMTIKGDDISISDKLYGGIYTLKQSQMIGLYLEPIKEFDMPSKLYGDVVGTEPQDGLLTLLDGLYSSIKLFVFTCNEIRKVNDYMIHRPSRIKYLFEYTTLDAQTIEDITNDMLKNKYNVQNMCVLADIYSTFTYDTLKALIDECNMLGVSPVEAIDGMNIKMECNDIRTRDDYEFTLFDKDGKATHTRECFDTKINPIGSMRFIEVYDENGKYKRVCYGRDNLIGYDRDTKLFSFATPEGTLVIKRREIIIPKDISGII